jgi:hypothetical protein
MEARTQDQKNIDLLNNKVAQFNTIKGARVGDYIKIDSDFYTRITHLWDDGTAQTGGGAGSQYYISAHGLSYSGGLDSGINVKYLEPTTETKQGCVWFFDKDISGAHRGITYQIDCRVFSLKTGAPLTGFSDYNKYKKDQYLNSLPKVTSVNGNDQIYTKPLPCIVINEKLTDWHKEKIERVTGLKFESNGYNHFTMQPETHEQLNNILIAVDWSIKRYSNAMLENHLILTYNIKD